MEWATGAATPAQRPTAWWKRPYELARHGVTVGISRTADTGGGLQEEIRKANAFAPDLAVEVHNNAGGGKGFEVYCQTNQFQNISESLARNIEAAVKAIGQTSRGLKTRKNDSGKDWFGWLRQVECPAVWSAPPFCARVRFWTGPITR